MLTCRLHGALQKKSAKQLEEEAAASVAKARAELAASLGKPHRPVMREKTETSITLALLRDGKKVPSKQVLQCRVSVRDAQFITLHRPVMREKTQTSIMLALWRDGKRV